MASGNNQTYLRSLEAIDEKLTRIAYARPDYMLAAAAMGSATVFRRYSKASGVFNYVMGGDVPDSLSLLIQKGNGCICIDEGPEPRLLCKGVHVGINSRELMMAAVSFFYKELTDTVPAFRLPHMAYCLQASDKDGNKVLMAFKLEQIGNGLDLSLIMKTELTDANASNLKTQVAELYADPTLNENHFAYNAAAYFKAHAYVSRRYGRHDGRECYFHIPTTKDKQDNLSRLVQENNGYIHIDETPCPRLLCEGMNTSVDKGQLMLAAIKYFYPTLTDIIVLKHGSKTSYCVSAKDASNFDVFLVFFFEPFDRGFNLLLIARHQFKTSTLTDVKLTAQKMLRQSTPMNDISLRIKECIIRLEDFGQLDSVRIPVCRIYSDGHSERITDLVPGTTFVNMVMSMSGTVYEQEKSVQNGTYTLCDNMVLPAGERPPANINTPSTAYYMNIKQLIESAMSHFFHLATDIEWMFPGQEARTDFCWKCNYEGSEYVLFCNVTEQDGKYSLILRGPYEADGIDPNHMKDVVDTIRRLDCEQNHSKSPLQSFAQVAQGCMHAFNQALRNGSIHNINSEHVVRMVTDRSYSKQLMIEDNFVKTVYAYSGIIHPLVSGITLPCTICSDMWGTSIDEVIRTCIPHFYYHEHLTDITYAFAPEYTVLKATHNDSSTVWLLIFQKLSNGAAEEYDVELMQIAKLRTFHAEAMLPDIIKRSGVKDPYSSEFSEALCELLFENGLI